MNFSKHSATQKFVQVEKILVAHCECWSTVTLAVLGRQEKKLEERERVRGIFGCQLLECVFRTIRPSVSYNNPKGQFVKSNKKHSGQTNILKERFCLRRSLILILMLPFSYILVRLPHHDARRNGSSTNEDRQSWANNIVSLWVAIAKLPVRRWTWWVAHVMNELCQLPSRGSKHVMVKVRSTPLHLLEQGEMRGVPH